MDSPPTPRGCHPARWFCVAAGSQAFIAERELAADGWPVYHPLHLDRHNNRIGPLFPGYLFVQFDPETAEWPRICRTRGVWCLLSNERSPVPLPEGVIEDLQARTSPRRVVDDPGSAPFPASMPAGTAVVAQDGPLAGLRGVVALSRQNRLSVLLSLFNRDVVTEVRHSAVARVA